MITTWVLVSVWVHASSAFPQEALNLDPRRLFGPEDVFEFVYLPELPQSMGYSNSEESIPYTFSAFGNEINLQLRPNRHIIGPSFRTIVKDRDGEEEVSTEIPDCHYLHRDASTAAAFSFCDPISVRGLLFLENDTLEVHPMPSYNSDKRRQMPHVVKRIPPFSHYFHDDYFVPPSWQTVHNQKKLNYTKRGGSPEKLTVELALFIDEKAYRTFMPYFQQHEDKMRDMALAYINGVQALYHHPSLGRTFELVLVRLEILKTQPKDLPHYNGERGLLLSSFCEYSAKYNPKGDDNPNHWDIGLYVTGLDMYNIENGKFKGATMGLANLGGVCSEQYNCVVAEMGTTNVFGKPYVSAGFNSVYILAHEIGHNLGMRHDDPKEGCAKDGYIMSPSRGSRGETTWSLCSSRAVASMDWASCLSDRGKPAVGLDHNIHHDTPGQFITAKKQCEFFLKDIDADVDTPGKLEEICQDLTCRTPHKSGYYFAGPALTGTNCGSNKWCEGGACVQSKASVKPSNVIKGGWSNWKSASCKSGCISKGRGYETRSRTCTNPKPVNTEEGCEGPSYDVRLCKDEKVCKSRKSAVTYATGKCKEFSSLVKALDSKASGLQAPHEKERLWMGCAIFCRHKDTGSYYTPRIDLNDLGVDPYFPDGTWCHNDGMSNYYCLQHHCLPENFIFVKEAFFTEDVPIPQNAPPNLQPLPDDIQKYLSIDQHGRPLLTTLKPQEKPSDDDWTDHDYMEIPQPLEMYFN